MYALPIKEVREPTTEEEQLQSALMGLLLHRFNVKYEREVSVLKDIHLAVNELHKR